MKRRSFSAGAPYAGCSVESSPADRPIAEYNMNVDGSAKNEEQRIFAAIVLANADQALRIHRHRRLCGARARCAARYHRTLRTACAMVTGNEVAQAGFKLEFQHGNLIGYKKRDRDSGSPNSRLPS